MSTTALPIKVVITAEDKASDVAGRAAERIKKKLSFAENLGKTNLATAGLGAAAAAMLVERISRPALALEDSLAQVRSVASGTFGSVEQDMSKVEDAARQWARAHTDSADSFVKSTYQMISAGLDTRAAIDGTRTALAVSKATMGDAVSTTGALATIFNTLGNRAADSSKEMTRIGDVLVRTQQYFQLSNMDQLTEGLKFGAPVAIQYRMSLEQLSTVVGQLNSLGLQGGMAGTSFAASMAQMNTAAQKLGFRIARTSEGGLDFLGTIDNIKEKFGDKLNLPKYQMAFQKAFGQEGLRAITLLVNKSDDLKKGYGELTSAAGATGRAQAIMEGTVNASFDRIKNNIADMGITMTQSMLPALQEAMPKITGMIDKLREHWDLVTSAVKVLAMTWFASVLPSAVVTAVTAISTNPQFAAFLVSIAAITAGLEAMEAYQKKQFRQKMSQGGKVKVFEGPAGKAELAQWQAEQRQAAGLEEAPGTASPTAGLTAGIAAMPTVAGAPVAVGGEIRVKFDNAPAGLQVEDIKASNRAVPITADVGRSRVAMGVP